MPFEEIEEIPQQSETTGEFLKRGALRTAARVGETVAGFPGDLAQLGLGVGSYLTKGAIPSYEQVKQKSPVYLPTSEDFRKEITQDISGNYLEPRNPNERFYDNIISDAASFLFPLKGIPKGLVGGAAHIVKSALKGLGKSSVANTADWLGTEIGGEKWGTGAKIGSILMMNLLGSRYNVRKLQEDMYNKAYKNLPTDKPFNITPEVKQMSQLERTIKNSDIRDRDFLLDRFKRFNELVTEEKAPKIQPSGLFGAKGEQLTNVIPGAEGGNIERMKELITLKQNWNDYLGDSTLRKSTRNELKKMIRIANQAIDRIETKYPEFGKYYKIGEELTTGLKTQNFMQKFLDKFPTIQDNVKNPLVSKILFGGLGSAVTLGAYLTPAKLALTGGLTAGALGAREVFRAYQLLKKSPAARQIYKSAMKAAATDNARLFKREALKLDNYFNKNALRLNEWHQIE